MVGSFGLLSIAPIEEGKLTGIEQLAPSYYPAIKPTGQNMPPQKFQELFNNYINNIKKISIISKAFNIKYLAVIQPMRHFEFDSCQARDNLSAEAMFYCKIIPAFESMDHQDKGLVYLSLADYLRDYDNLFVDECHFDDQGNEIVAEKILEVINQRHLLGN